MGEIKKGRICLWFNKDAAEAAEFYANTFPDSSVGKITRAAMDNPSTKAGEVITVEFEVMGIQCLGLNGGPAFQQSEAFSFQITTEDQEETDRYWNAIVAEGEESMCGWCKDKWGVSWQITPRVLTEATTGADRDKAARAFAAMMEMKKIDVAAIEAACRD